MKGIYSGQSSVKNLRRKMAGVLLGLKSDPGRKGAIIDDDKGIYQYLDGTIADPREKVKYTDKNGQEQIGSKLVRVRFNGVDCTKMEELKKAVDCLAAGKKPFVTFSYYETETPMFEKDDSGQEKIVNGKKVPVTEEVEEVRNGKNVIVQREKKYINRKCGDMDLIKGFQVLAEDANLINAAEAIEKIEAFFNVTEEDIKDYCAKKKIQVTPEGASMMILNDRNKEFAKMANSFITPAKVGNKPVVEEQIKVTVESVLESPMAKILSILDLKKTSVNVTNLIQLMTSQGYTEKDVSNAIEQLKREGGIFEPKAGMIQAL